MNLSLSETKPRLSYVLSREIDAFIFHLKNTLKFFTSLETPLSSTGGDTNGDHADDDGFVPFI
jgi:hypothetical protein